MLNFTLRQLGYAIQTADSGSVAAAAEILRVAQSEELCAAWWRVAQVFEKFCVDYFKTVQK